MIVIISEQVINKMSLLLNFFKVGSLAAIHLGKLGHKVNLYEYREGESSIFFWKSNN